MERVPFDKKFLAAQLIAAGRYSFHQVRTNPAHFALQMLRRLPRKLTSTIAAHIPATRHSCRLVRAALIQDVSALANEIGSPPQSAIEAELAVEARSNPGSTYPHANALWLASIGNIPGAVQEAQKLPRPYLASALLDSAAIATPNFALPLNRLVHVDHGEFDSPIRVLHIVTNSLPHTASGYSLRTHAILRSQRAEGIDARAVTRLNYPAEIGRIARDHCEYIDSVPYYRIADPAVRPGEPYKLLSEAKKIISAVNKLAREEGWQPHILHTTTDFRNGLITQAVATQLGVPWVYETRGELHNTWLSRVPEPLRAEAKNSWYYEAIQAKELKIARSAHAVIALSQVQRSQLIKAGISSARISVVPNAIDGEHIGRTISTARARALLGLPHTATIFGSVSAVVGYEGFEYALRAVALLRAQLPERDFRFVLVGDGTALPELKTMAQHLGVADAAIFAGKMSPDVARTWYQALDCFVIPRIDSAVTRGVTPIKGLQAAAYGIPIVASDLPALAEVTPPAPAGTLVPPENPKALATAIAAATAAPPTIRERSKQAAAEFARTHTWEANAHSYRAVYELLIEQRRF